MVSSNTADSAESSPLIAVVPSLSKNASDQSNGDIENNPVSVKRDYSSIGGSYRAEGSSERTTSDHTAKVYGTLAVSVLLGLVSGTLYGYGRYARDLKNALDLSQLEVQRLGILMDTGNYFGHPITGYVYDHYGPQLGCLGGAMVVFFGYFIIHMGVVDVDTFTFPDGVLDAAFLMVGFGTGLGYISALGSTAKNFAKSSYKSLAVAVVASGYGLCSTLVGISYKKLGLKHFFLFWAVLIAVVNFLGASVFEFDGEGLHGSHDQDETDHEDEEDEEEEASVDEAIVKTKRISEHGSLISLELRQRFSALRTGDFWILFAALASCTGCGLFVINNVSLMVESVGGSDDLAGNLVIILSFSNCAGRIIMGSLADRLSKLGLFAGASIVMAIGLFLSAQATMENAQTCLVVTVVMVAMAYGGLWVLIVGILSEWFGTHDFGKNYGVIAMGPAVSGMIFNASSAFMYERYANHSMCMGTECYRDSFILAGSAATSTSLLLSWLAYRRHQNQVKPR